MSFNKKVTFPVSPTGFRVRSVLPAPLPLQEVNEQNQKYFEDGKKKAKEFYLAEIGQLKDDLAAKQKHILDEISNRADATLELLNRNLPDLVMEIVQKILPQVELSGIDIEKIVRSLIKEFSDEDEQLEVFLCPDDLKLLKALGSKADLEKGNSDSTDEAEDGFASAIAGIFDNLDGDDSVLADLPKVKFFEDSSLKTGDCQIKSKFGLLDGRIATKIRKIKEELTGNG